MADLKAQVREMASVIEAKEAEAAKARGELKGLITSAQAEGVDLTTGDAFNKIDAAGKQYDSIKQEVEGMKSRRARLLEVLAEEAGEVGSKAEARIAATYGESLVSSDEYKAARERVLSSDNIPLGATAAIKVADRAQVKTLLSSSNAQSPVADRQNFIVGTPLAGLDFLSVIATGITDSDVVEYLEETTYTNAAAGTAENTDAPESAIAFTKRTANVREVVHFLPITRRAMADQAFVESWVNSRMIDGVRRRLQSQVLSGGGTGQDFQGIYGASGVGSVDRSDTSLSMLDSLHRCITTIRTNAFVEPDFIGIHPDDWDAIRIAKQTLTLGTGSTNATIGGAGYIYGNPVDGGPTTLWGVRAIVHAAFTSGTPLVGRGADATLWVREGLSVSMSDSHSDYFIKRNVAVLGTIRAAFAVTQPKAFAKSVA